MQARAPDDSALRSSTASASARDNMIARKCSSAPMIRRVLELQKRNRKNTVNDR